MSTKVNTDIKLFNNSGSNTGEKANGFDFSKLNIGDIMLNGTKTEKKRLLALMKEEGISPMRAYLNYVQAHNEPIKEEIAFYQDEIHSSRHELSALKRAYRQAEDVEEQTFLKEQITSTKRNIWDMCKANVRRAFSLA